MTLPGFAADWPAPAGVRTWQTVREGGCSNGRYASLNLGDHVGDDPAAVAANRAAVVDGLNVACDPVWLEQVHGTRIADLDSIGRRRFSDAAAITADGAMTRARGTVAAVMTADCLPVLLCNVAGTEVAAAHAGWRGLAAGVLEAAVAAFDAAPESVIAWLGPAIGAAAFEVGADVREAFVRLGPAYEAAFRENARGRWQADLYRLARCRLKAAGVRSISGGGYCTYTDSTRFFSHRRQNPCGRQATLIWLD